MQLSCFNHIMVPGRERGCAARDEERRRPRRVRRFRPHGRGATQMGFADPQSPGIYWLLRLLGQFIGTGFVFSLILKPIMGAAFSFTDVYCLRTVAASAPDPVLQDNIDRCVAQDRLHAVGKVRWNQPRGAIPEGRSAGGPCPVRRFKPHGRGIPLGYAVTNAPVRSPL